MTMTYKGAYLEAYLGFSIEVIEDCLRDGVNDQYISLKDLDDISKDLSRHGGEIGEKVAEKLQRHIMEEVLEKGLCPKCMEQMEDGGYQTITEGEFWGAPTRYKVATVRFCRECGHSEPM